MPEAQTPVPIEAPESSAQWPLVAGMRAILQDANWAELASASCRDIASATEVAAIWALRWPRADQYEVLAQAGNEDLLLAMQAQSWQQVQDGELLTLALSSPWRHLPPRHLISEHTLELPSLAEVRHAVLIPVLEQTDTPWTFIMLLRKPLPTPEALACKLQELWDTQDRMTQRKLVSDALEQAANSVFITNADAQILWANTAFTSLTGYPRSQVLGRNPRLLNSGRQSPRYYRQLWQTISAGKPWTAEVTDKDRYGYLYTIQQTISPVLEQGRVTHYLSIHDDISHRKTLQLNHEREHPSQNLTGLMNRTAFFDSVSLRTHDSALTHGRFSVLSFSLLNFNSVHGALGKESGQRLLREIGVRIRATLPEGGFGCHFGGGDFGFCLLHPTAAEVQQWSARLLQALNAEYPILDAAPYFSCSMGMAFFRDDGRTADELWKAADGANGAP